MTLSRANVAPLVLVVVVLITAWASRVIEGRRSLEASDSATRRGDHVEAIVQARAAAEARCPGCGSTELGYAKLYAIAKDAEGRGDDAIAVASWRAVRAASLATAVFDVAPATRARADAEIARLEHRIDAKASAAGAPPSPAASEDRLRATLAGSFVPSGALFLLLAVGGLVFARSAVQLVRAPALRAREIAVALAGAAAAAVGVLFF